MATSRFQALRELQGRKALHTEQPAIRISEYFGRNVFNTDAMRQYMTKDAFKAVEEATVHGTTIDRKVADEVASSMKSWAINKGATHYTHWFQPLTGTTAEKHDSFFEPTHGGGAVEKFDGTMLVQQEPDASSFPNGGIRNTFEARGYTVWDPSSPAFIIDKTLCIPTIFIAYTGESLDNKMPLLKALSAVDSAATKVAQYFDKNVSKVSTSLGWEQEYFLIDEALYNARPDLMMAGRALFGHIAAKGQQLDDHYFGAIPERITAFMRDAETEALMLGIPVRTRHNEVAPNQFECAPIFEEANLANDHNLLLMNVFEKVARKHNFRILYHEKPFAGLNGSGKHNNWSLSTNTGVNLLAPGKNPKSNFQFLTFLINTIKAIKDNADVLRASIASASNDHRLGANEAPPAIISVFIGTKLTEVLNMLEANESIGSLTAEEKTELKLSIGRIPSLLLDNTDRNRTSPFAFTGNKFEFRAVGSSANCAQAMIALNTMVANQLENFKVEVDTLIDGGSKKDDAIFQVLRELIIDAKPILFEGNGYGEEWRKEAEKRGLSNILDTPRAIDLLDSKHFVELYGKHNVLTARELEARKEIEYENYLKKIQIESRIMGDLARNHIIPAVVAYQNRLVTNIDGFIRIFGDEEGRKQASGQIKILNKISAHVNTIVNEVEQMIECRKVANNLDDIRKASFMYCDTVKPFFESIRYHVDKLEVLVDDELWPLPKLREMLFHK